MAGGDVDQARERCERCGASRRGQAGDRAPWCPACVELLRRGSADARRSYRRDYQRAYQRARRQALGEARSKWVVLAEGRRTQVALRRRDATVIATGRFGGLDAARSLVRDVLGAATAGYRESASGGGRGRRRQSRFRIEAPLGAGGAAEFYRVMAALERGGRAARVETFSGSGEK